MKLSHINHDEKIYTAVFLNFILTSRIKVIIYLFIFNTFQKKEGYSHSNIE